MFLKKDLELVLRCLVSSEIFVKILRNHHQISPLILSEYKRINYLLTPLKSSENL